MIIFNIAFIIYAQTMGGYGEKLNALSVGIRFNDQNLSVTLSEPCNHHSGHLLIISTFQSSLDYIDRN